MTYTRIHRRAVPAGRIHSSPYSVENKEWFKKAAYLLRRRSAVTRLKWVKGHNGELGNEKFDLQGGKLMVMTQGIVITKSGRTIYGQ